MEFDSVKLSSSDIGDLETAIPASLASDLFFVMTDIASELDLDVLLKNVIDRASIFYSASFVAIYSWNAEDGMLEYLADSSDSKKLFGDIAVELGVGAAGLACKERRIVIIDDYLSWEDKQIPGGIPSGGYDRVMAAWLAGRNDELIGAITIVRPADKPPFSEIDAIRLRAFGMLVSIAINNAEDRKRIVELNRELAWQNWIQSLDLSTLEQSLKERNIELMRLLHEAEMVRADERARLARDMHDDALQYLYGSKALISVAKSTLSTNGEAAIEAIDRAITYIDQSEKAIRYAIEGLMNPVNNDSGFISGLRHYAESLASTQALKLVFKDETDGFKQLSSDAQSVVFRVLQEAIRNAGEHAHATTVTITVGHADSAFTLAVEDNGKGAELEEIDGRKIVPKRNHYGMRIMYERSEELGATLSIDSKIGEGMKVVLTVPADACIRIRTNE